MIKKYIQDIIDHPLLSISVIGNLFFIESILSIDNAIILSSMIMKLEKKEDQKMAIKYGIIGAYLFRVLCLLFTSKLINLQWLKILGSIYLIVNGFSYYFSNENHGKNKKKLNKNLQKKNLWKTILSIEIMDLSFSIDNIFASVALSKNLLLIFLGTFISLLSIRLTTKYFIKLIKRFPDLNKSISMIIILLGMKLMFSIIKNEYSLFKKLSFFYDKIEILFTIIILFLFLIPFFLKKKL